VGIPEQDFFIRNEGEREGCLKLSIDVLVDTDNIVFRHDQGDSKGATVHRKEEEWVGEDDRISLLVFRLGGISGKEGFRGFGVEGGRV
jgi:hypothetical protein